MPTSTEQLVPRVMPRLTSANRAFWTGGANGELLICFCSRCDRWVHPPVDSCPTCDGELEPRAVSGRGTIFTFTVNTHTYHPDVAPPYVIALVELEEQGGLRLPTNIVNCEPGDVHIGAPVRVVFQECDGGIVVPFFEPASR